MKNRKTNTAKRIFIILGVLLVGAVIAYLARVEVTNTVWEKSIVLNINSGEMVCYPIRFVIPRTIEFLIIPENSSEIGFVILTEKQFEVSMRSGKLPRVDDLVCMKTFSGTFQELIGPLKEGKYYAMVMNSHNEPSLAVSITIRLLNKYYK